MLQNSAKVSFQGKDDKVKVLICNSVENSYELDINQKSHRKTNEKKERGSIQLQTVEQESDDTESFMAKSLELNRKEVSEILDSRKSPLLIEKSKTQTFLENQPCQKDKVMVKSQDLTADNVKLNHDEFSASSETVI